MSDTHKSNISLILCTLIILFMVGDKIAGAASSSKGSLEYRVTALENAQKEMAGNIARIDRRNEQLLIVAKTAEGRLNGIEKSMAALDRWLALWTTAKKTK